MRKELRTVSVDGKLTPDALGKRIDSLVQGSRELDASVDAKRAEGKPIDERVLGCGSARGGGRCEHGRAEEV